MRKLYLGGGDSYTMKYTPHIIAAIAVAVVATAALAATTSGNTITHTMVVNGDTITDIQDEYTFNFQDDITIIASEPVEYRYYSTGSNYQLHDETIESATLTIDSSVVGKHTVDWKNIDQSAGWQGGVLTKIFIKHDVTSISFMAEDRRSNSFIRSYGVSFGDTISTDSILTYKLKAANHQVHWKEEIYKGGSLDKTETGYGQKYQVSNKEGNSKNEVFVSTDNKNWTLLATIHIDHVSKATSLP